MRKEEGKEKKEGKLSQRRRQKGRDKKEICCLGREERRNKDYSGERKGRITKSRKTRVKKSEERRLTREGWKGSNEKENIYQGRKEETKITWGIGGGIKRIN
jgi:hypothetical protein